MSAAPAAPLRASVRWETKLFIDGEAVEGTDLPFDVYNPATERRVARVPGASPEQVGAAVSAARRALQSDKWRSAEFRSEALDRFADLLERHAEELGAALVEEMGTPVGLVGPLQLGVPIKLFRYYARLARVDRTRELGPDEGAAPSASRVYYLPVGVVGAITAYNYPLILFANKVAPALAAGCSVVVLPSPLAPLATLMLGALIDAAGIPAGVVNLLVGGEPVGRALTEHADVDKVSFTGSVAVGRAVMRQAASTVKGVVLELGGKSPAVFLPDADFSRSVAGCHLRYLRNAGQGCASPTRLIVPETRIDEFLAVSRGVFASVKVGDPWDPGTVVGPLISAAHRDRVEGYVRRAVDAGASIAAGGGRPALPTGWYMNPTLLSNLDNSFEISREELFGPVGVVIPYRDLAEAISIANDSPLGLAAAVYGPHEAAMAVARDLRAGEVSVNGGGALRVDAPMGGFKQSGIGREHGEEALHEYLEPQHIQWSI